MTTYFAPWAWLPEGLTADVRLTVADGRFGRVEAGAGVAEADERLPGIVLPGFANTHSHAFHRALRGRTHAGGGSFWTWRSVMYSVANRLDPENYFRLARAVFAEMALAGVTCVGEFHYVHHRPDGTPYADANAMGHAVIAAARAAGIRITLLDTCYLSGGLGRDGPLVLSPHQRRRDGDVSPNDWDYRGDRPSMGRGERRWERGDDHQGYGARFDHPYGPGFPEPYGIGPYEEIAVPLAPAVDLDRRGPDVGCTIQRSETTTAVGWRKIVTHKTCYRR